MFGAQILGSQQDIHCLVSMLHGVLFPLLDCVISCQECDSWLTDVV